ncbi:MAG: agmatine deiminase family protein [Bacteroidetes bacterium]|nr:agmatine deiminase family protein [Bacteroidota bacterium]
MMRQFCTTLILIFFMATAAMAQDNSRDNRPALRHEMTPDELLRKSEIGRGFVQTDPPVAPVRNVGEYERMQGALVRYPFGIPISLIKEMATDVTVTTIVASVSQKSTVVGQYLANGVDTSHCNFLIAPSDSYWTRDFGPWFESDSAGQIGIVDFPYNRPRPNDDEIPKKVAAMLGIPWFGMNLISTGGNYMTDGYGISSSTQLVYEENPALTTTQVAQEVQDYLGIQDYMVRPDPNGTYIDHIDCWGKFLGPDKILIRKVPSTHQQYAQIEAAAAYWAATNCSYGYPYKVFRVNTPQDQPYTNSIILNDKVLMPFMNSTLDAAAKAVYEEALPGYEVIGFTGNSSTPWESTDALHCRVMGIADLGLLHIKHFPIYGNQPCETDYQVNADIMASSHQPVKSDSMLIHYEVNGGQYQTALMQNSSGNHYSGFIPKQPAGSVIRYYLTAADESGRHAAAPFIGAADPFIFQTVYTNLTAIPDTVWLITPDDCSYGKVVQLHNYSVNGIGLNDIQHNGAFLPWYVDSMSVTGFPHVVNVGDSVAFRVKMPVLLSKNPDMIYVTDTLRVSTAAGILPVIIMINRDLLTSIAETAILPEIGSNYPNPFSTVTTIPLEIARRGHVTLEILDIRGTRVKTLISDVLEQGSVSTPWDGTDDHGKMLSGGVYLCRLTTEKNVKAIRITLLR